ncbi:MAG: MFS transporter [Polaromonas sp.]|nr:MFS transporter [Polaromonas sp.]
MPGPADKAHPDRLDRQTGALVFLVFAAAYFCSALVRSITATLSPVLTQAFSLQARDLGLLAGGYFFGFAAMQLPLGAWLDRHGPQRVILWFLSLAVLGCLAFSAASSFAGLLASRVLVGMGVSACLMAPLTGYRRWFDAATLLRANSWMLMVGSLGMLASTLPVQWLLPLTGWRPLFWILAALLLLSMAGIAYVTPAWKATPTPGVSNFPPAPASYAPVWKSRYFRKMAPLAFFNYGGMVAIQTLWAGPWMARVAGYSPIEAATGLFYLNAAMLLTFLAWGLVTPWLAQRGWNATRLITWGVPLSLLALAVNMLSGAQTGWLGWALFCVASSVMGLAQPAVGMAFQATLAGRALSGYNLVIFAGVFVAQWGIGLLVDAFAALGLDTVASFQAAMGVFLCCCIASYAYFLSVNADNSPQ